MYTHNVWCVRSTGIRLRPHKPVKMAEKPAAESAAAAAPLPYHVHRSRMGNLPVYHDFRGGSREVTVLRKYSGDVEALARDLEELCDAPVTMYHGRLEVKGTYGGVLRKWLAKSGF